MYYTGLDPRTMEEVYVPKSPHEKALQRALIQYRNPKNHALVVEALTKAGRTDLIGFGRECLIRPRVTKSEADRQSGKSGSGKRAGGKKSAEKNGKQRNGRRTTTSSSKNTAMQENRKSGAGRANSSKTGSGKKRTKSSEMRAGRK